MPGGGENPKKSLKVNGASEAAAGMQDGSFQADMSTETYADGPATVAGMSGFWTADGGCNKATISAKYAEKLVTHGTEDF